MKSIAIMLAIISFLILFNTKLSAQMDFGRVDSLAVGDSSITDTTYNIAWDFCSIKFVNTAGYVKIGAPDTTSWALRKWIPLEEGEILNVGERTRLRRLSAYCVADTGSIIIVGSKKSKEAY